MRKESRLLYRWVVALRRSAELSRILFCRQGLFRSMMTGTPVGSKDEPIPWFTYPAIEYLKRFDFSDKKVFEYGAGHSSLFWASRAMTVTTVESNEKWHAHIALKRPPNLTLYLEPEKEKYVSSIGRDVAVYDVIVIDGQWRNACAEICADYLADRGMIIFDNSDRRYEGCAKLRARGFFQVDFSGFSPINGYTSTTSIFIGPLIPAQSNFVSSDPVGGQMIYAGDDD